MSKTDRSHGYRVHAYVIFLAWSNTLQKGKASKKSELLPGNDLQVATHRLAQSFRFWFVDDFPGERAELSSELTKQVAVGVVKRCCIKSAL